MGWGVGTARLSPRVRARPVSLQGVGGAHVSPGRRRGHFLPRFGHRGAQGCGWAPGRPCPPPPPPHPAPPRPAPPRPYPHAHPTLPSTLRPSTLPPSLLPPQLSPPSTTPSCLGDLQPGVGHGHGAAGRDAVEKPLLHRVVVQGTVDVDGADGRPGDAPGGQQLLGVLLANVARLGVERVPLDVWRLVRLQVDAGRRAKDVLRDDAGGTVGTRRVGQGGAWWGRGAVVRAGRGGSEARW